MIYYFSLWREQLSVHQNQISVILGVIRTTLANHVLASHRSSPILVNRVIAVLAGRVQSASHRGAPHYLQKMNDLNLKCFLFTFLSGTLFSFHCTQDKRGGSHWGLCDHICYLTSIVVWQCHTCIPHWAWTQREEQCHRCCRYLQAGGSRGGRKQDDIWLLSLPFVTPVAQHLS